MSFMLHFKGGPLDGGKEESRHAPQTIALTAEQAGGTPGIYSLERISGVKAFLVWRSRPLRALQEPA